MLALQRTLTPSRRGFDSHPAYQLEGQANVEMAAVSKAVELYTSLAGSTPVPSAIPNTAPRKYVATLAGRCT